METRWLDLDAIEVGDRLRPVDPHHVERLAASIKEIGLQTPLSVMMKPAGDETHMILVAGLHRMEALRSLGEDGAYCVVLPEDADLVALWEIDENLARAELTDAQRAEHHARREAILVRRGGASTPGRGGDRSNGQNVRSYASQAAETLGVDERTVRRDLRRGKNIAPEVLADVAGTDLDKGVVLDELASTPKPDQRAKLAEIALRRQEAERARQDAETANRHTDRVIALTDAQQFAEWLLARTGLNELPTIISWLEGTKAKDVIAALRREAA